MDLNNSYYIQLPFRKNEYNYEYSVVIGSTTYILWIYFNRRMGRWILNVKDENNNPLIMGVSILVGSQMLARFANEALRDIKYIFAFNVKDRYVEIGEFDLGNTATVYVAHELE
jgi:hypothetical protein